MPGADGSEFSCSDPRLSIPFITVSLLSNITARRSASCAFVSLGMRPASAASRAAMQLREAEPVVEEAFHHVLGRALVYFHGLEA